MAISSLALSHQDGRETQEATRAAVAPLEAARDLVGGDAARPIQSQTAMQHLPPHDLESLFKTHHALVFRVAYRVTGSASDAEDVLQTVFLRLAHTDPAKRSAFTESHPERYVRGAGINAALDFGGARGRAPHVSTDDTPEPLASRDPESDPETKRAAGEVRDALREALARMNNNAAAAFALRYFEGLDNKQIAVMLDTSPLVIGVMLHRARGVLRKELQQFAENSK